LHQGGANLAKTVFPNFGEVNKSGERSKSIMDCNEISFKLLTTDEKNNKYYIYPTDEELFKREAFERGGIFVGIIHHNGYIEYIERQVNKIWKTTVFWNINSMSTQYRDLKHLSDANNLTVYACPININLKSNEQWLREIASKNRGKNA
jgi:hypothetical protein